jgi:hypothetical protein
MVQPTPFFWRTPLRYIRWAAREQPAYFWSVIIGGMGPLIVVSTPLHERLTGYKRAPPIPMTYPGTYEEERHAGAQAKPDRLPVTDG